MISFVEFVSKEPMCCVVSGVLGRFQMDARFRSDTKQQISLTKAEQIGRVVVPVGTSNQ